MPPFSVYVNSLLLLVLLLLLPLLHSQARI
jgi:hypothetical protein